MKKILVGDRNIALQKLIELRMNDKELDVMMASDTEETKEAIEKEPIDLMILDIDLPSEGALPIYKKIKSSPELAHIPIMLLVKGLEESDSRLNDFEGLDMVLARPFEASDFIDAIGQLLDKCIEPTEALEGLFNDLPEEKIEKNREESVEDTSERDKADAQAEILATEEVEDTILTDLPESLIVEDKEEEEAETPASQEFQADFFAGIGSVQNGEVYEYEKEVTGEGDDDVQPETADTLTDVTEAIASEEKEEMEGIREEIETDTQPEEVSGNKEIEEDSPAYMADAHAIEESTNEEEIKEKDEERDTLRVETAEESVPAEGETDFDFNKLAMERWLKKVIILRVERVMQESIKEIFQEQVQNLVQDLAEKLILEEIERIKGGKAEE